MHFLNLIRYKNLLLLLLTQVLVHFGFLKALDFPVALSTLDFFILVMATLCIAAAGYVINDIEDVEIDRINRPKKRLIPLKITEKRAFNYYLALNIAGVGLGYYLSVQSGNSAYAAFFVFISALLYSYATFLKRILLVGNILVSILVASAILIVVIFDLSALVSTYGPSLSNPVSVLRDYAIFAFLLNVLREIVKDLEDMDGDHAHGLSSLPIVLGRVRTAKITSVVALGYIALLVVYIYFYLYTNAITTAYLLFVVGGSLLFFAIKAWAATSKKDFARLSLYLKISMVLGIFSLGVLSLSLLYAAF
ncbi:geranylgeranylglycerol-phosphate geranylgeranyltransferase [Flavimarina sp. Hel_I_48]|uniref:geranylgeranylglycerol-phosphate geranylgeranyltransferase n=1 Tax=Flavimarina sp. Hel_I_48 TaxID=1392488 RepID=UPI0004DEFE1F|nr:geranylgeranylglycerol-phosphate geranylgeranyltransferase [Flavimarina sp. Hel_I_48]